MWTIEWIPDADSVFMRAHAMHFRDGKLSPGVFSPHNGGMSVNWEKYASADETKQQARKPEANAVAVLRVGSIRAIDGLTVGHTPEPTNRAHSDVFGLTRDERLAEIRILLLRIARIAIPLEPDGKA